MHPARMTRSQARIFRLTANHASRLRLAAFGRGSCARRRLHKKSQESLSDMVLWLLEVSVAAVCHL